MSTNEKVTAAIESLTEGIEQLIESDEWTAYLDTQARFHRYSANNTLLILIQRPDATQVAGYRAWQGMGRQVRKGEKAIKILAPCTVKADPDNPDDKRRKLVGFRVASVFDVSQTDGEPLPQPAHLLEGDGDAAALDAIADLIGAAGFRYESAPVDGSANGYTDHADKIVRVDSTMDLAQQVKTAAHELAHVLMHNPDDEHRPADRAVCEVEAESVAYVVLHALGFDAGAYSFGYVAGWSAGDVDTVKRTAERVQRTAAQVIEQLTDTAADRDEVAA